MFIECSLSGEADIILGSMRTGTEILFLAGAVHSPDQSSIISTVSRPRFQRSRGPEERLRVLSSCGLILGFFFPSRMPSLHLLLLLGCRSQQRERRFLFGFFLVYKFLCTGFFQHFFITERCPCSRLLRLQRQFLRSWDVVAFVNANCPVAQRSFRRRHIKGPFDDGEITSVRFQNETYSVIAGKKPVRQEDDTAVNEFTAQVPK
ncbi:hypothetical protein ARMGADRAFT_143795 [Armillaria gallica]|uniref:Uncharacterized protein n=1 Tax=Armillaria gallica TaxID=47427 RepID=A0A2H3DCL3_ARMGA|nr:hypothetical protein ARMGADRAFT_143795 [Armillaria gallica]